MDSNLIVLTDQDGNSVRFELLDRLYNGGRNEKDIIIYAGELFEGVQQSGGR